MLYGDIQMKKESLCLEMTPMELAEGGEEDV